MVGRSAAGNSRRHTGGEENRKCRGLLTGSGVKLEAICTVDSGSVEDPDTIQRTCEVCSTGEEGPWSEDVLDREGDRDGQTKHVRRRKYTKNYGVSVQQIRY